MKKTIAIILLTAATSFAGDPPGSDERFIPEEFKRHRAEIAEAKRQLEEIREKYTRSEQESVEKAKEMAVKREAEIKEARLRKEEEQERARREAEAKPTPANMQYSSAHRDLEDQVRDLELELDRIHMETHDYPRR
jgi:Skp family chaperone for outer membrane proteins